jgi:hypothetical protein
VDTLEYFAATFPKLLKIEKVKRFRKVHKVIVTCNVCGMKWEARPGAKIRPIEITAMNDHIGVCGSAPRDSSGDYQKIPF